MKKTLTFLTFTLVIFLQGTAQETTFELVKDIFPNGDANPQNIIAGDGLLYFSAQDDLNGTELWVSDGTESGTNLLMDINEGINNSDPSQLSLLENQLIFTADDGVNGNELWVSDGTLAGTHLLKDINEGENSSYAFEFFPYNGKLLFRADDGVHGTELWVTDGTEAGTVMVKEVRTGEFGGNPSNFAEYNGLVYFRGVDGFAPDGHGFELWVTDGTEAGTALAVDINPNENGNPEGITAFNGKLYFNATGETGGIELWSSDGTQAGTSMVKDINTGGNSNSLPANFTIYNDQLYFTAYSSETGRELWVTDGTEAGTHILKDVYPGIEGGVVPQFDIIVYKDHLYFTAMNDTHGAEIWMSDGTEANTQLLKDIFPGPESSMSQGGRVAFAVSNELLYFRAIDDLENYYQLWFSDGTEDGTQKLMQSAEPHSGALGFNPNFTTLGNSLYFAANYEDETDLELWKLTNEILGTESFYESTLTYYPNPVKHKLSLVSSGNIENVAVYNLVGQKIAEFTMDAAGAIDMSAVASGVYIVKASINNIQNVFKVVKE